MDSLDVPSGVRSTSVRLAAVIGPQSMQLAVCLRFPPHSVEDCLDELTSVAPILGSDFPFSSDCSGPLGCLRYFSSPHPTPTPLLQHTPFATVPDGSSLPPSPSPLSLPVSPLDLLDAELSPERYRLGSRSQEVGEERSIPNVRDRYLTSEIDTYHVTKMYHHNDSEFRGAATRATLMSH